MGTFWTVDNNLALLCGIDTVGIMSTSTILTIDEIAISANTPDEIFITILEELHVRNWLDGDVKK